MKFEYENPNNSEDSVWFNDGKLGSSAYSYTIDSVGCVSLNKQETRKLYESMRKYYLESDRYSKWPDHVVDKLTPKIFDFPTNCVKEFIKTLRVYLDSLGVDYKDLRDCCSIYYFQLNELIYEYRKVSGLSEIIPRPFRADDPICYQVFNDSIYKNFMEELEP